MFQIAPTVSSIMQIVQENVTSHRKMLSPPIYVPTLAHLNLPFNVPNNLQYTAPVDIPCMLCFSNNGLFADVLQHMRRWGPDGTVQMVIYQHWARVHFPRCSRMPPTVNPAITRLLHMILTMGLMLFIPAT